MYIYIYKYTITNYTQCSLHQGHGYIYLSTNFLRDQPPMPKLELAGYNLLKMYYSTEQK